MFARSYALRGFVRLCLVAESAKKAAAEKAVVEWVKDGMAVVLVVFFRLRVCCAHLSHSNAHTRL